MKFCRKAISNKHFFTLIEVVTAMAILAMVLLTSLALSGSAQHRSLRAGRELREKNMLIFAAEYFQLNPSAEEIPEDLFQFAPYRVERILTDLENLPDEVQDQRGEYRLVKMTVNLWRNEKICRSLELECIIDARD